MKLLGMRYRAQALIPKPERPSAPVTRKDDRRYQRAADARWVADTPEIPGEEADVDYDIEPRDDYLGMDSFEKKQEKILALDRVLDRRAGMGADSPDWVKAGKGMQHPHANRLVRRSISY